jgi:hypothetical protein
MSWCGGEEFGAARVGDGDGGGDGVFGGGAAGWRVFSFSFSKTRIASRRPDAIRWITNAIIVLK